MYNRKLTDKELKINYEIDKIENLLNNIYLDMYYKIYDNTIVIDVTECKNIEESTQKVMENIKLPELV